MMSRFARTGRTRACVLVALLLSVAAAAAPAPTPPVPSAPAAGGTAPQLPSPAAAFEPLKQSLDRITAALRQDGLSDEAYGALKRELQQVREDLDGEMAKIAPRLSEVDARLTELGQPPAAGAPPEDATIAAERERLTRVRAGIDSALKQGRLLGVQSDHLAERISERRRLVFAHELFKRTGSVLDAAFWRDAAAATRDEAGGIRDLLQSWWSY